MDTYGFDYFVAVCGIVNEDDDAMFIREWVMFYTGFEIINIDDDFIIINHTCNIQQIQSSSMDKELKKQKIQKLEKKLENRQFTLYEVLQEDIAVDWFRSLHPAFLAMLDSKGFAQMISYVTDIGPPENRMRSYKIPMISAEILSTMIPKVFQLFFMEDQQNKGDILLGRLLNYFQKQPNYVLSGYVVKIIMNLMAGNAPRVLEYLFKNGKIMKITNYLQSLSMVDLLFRIIIVQDVLLNNKIKERIELFKSVVDVYAENKQSPEVLDHANHFLCESFIRFWTLKHKELGRFSTEIFRVVELVIDNNNLYKQENLMIIIMKHLTNYADDAPFLIIALFKKIHREISLTHQNPETVKTQFKQNISKFSMKNLKLLQSLGSMFLNIPQIMIKQLKTNNIFNYLLQFIAKYEWNSIVLVEIQKILKHALGPVSSSTSSSTNQTTPAPNTGSSSKIEQHQKMKDVHYESLYQILFNQTNFAGKIKQLIKKQSDKSRNFSNNLIGRGYTGFLINLCKYIKQIAKEGTVMGTLIQKNQRQLMECIENYLKIKEQPYSTIEGFNVVHDVARPHYHLNTIVDQYKQFFEEAEAVNKKYQVERPKSLHNDMKQDVLHQIENENEVVSKLMTESTEQKKSETIGENVQ